MTIEPRVLPTADEWREYGISAPIELHAGKQSRVFSARVRDIDVAVKLTDGRLADAGLLAARMRMVESLASHDPCVVRPHRFDGRLVQPIGGWLMTGTAMTRGDKVDTAQPDSAMRMGAALARLHVSMAALPLQPLPTIAALSGVEHVTWSAAQLLHGDFSAMNVVSTPAGLRIFDFDDCGYGPIEYDIANSLYMEFFDAAVNDQRSEYETFRPAFLEGYATASGGPIQDGMVDEMIERRISALGRWLDDLSTAPIGIRAASAEWHETLRAFVRSHGRPGS